MISTNKKEMGKKTISVFEIFLLVTSIVAIAYFVGDEFRLVSAEGGPTGASCTYKDITYKSGEPRTFSASNPPSDTRCVITKDLISCTETCVDGIWGGKDPMNYQCSCTSKPTTGSKITCGTGITQDKPYSNVGCAGQCLGCTGDCWKKCDFSTGIFGKCLCVNEKKKDNLVDKAVSAAPIISDAISPEDKKKLKETTSSGSAADNAKCSLTCTDLGYNKGGTCKTSCGGNEEEVLGFCGTKTTGNICCCDKSSIGYPDADKDEVPDYKDQCPGQKEDRLGDNPDDGCPNGVAPTNAPPTNNTELLNQIGAYAGAIISNALIALGIYTGTQLLKNFDIMPPEVVDQLSLALSLGYGAGSLLATLAGTVSVAGEITYFGGAMTLPVIGAVPVLGLVGIGIGAIIWALTAADEKVIAVYYTCNQWQPPKGGEDCDKCNSGEFICTSYKCQSLGKSCRLLNQGTAEEKCTWVNPNDIEPPAIVSWNKPLKEGFYYEPASARLTPTQTGSEGVSIKYNGANADSQNCVPPYTILKFGIGLTDGTGKPKLGHCKYDIVRTDTFSEMKYNVDNLWDMYNHTFTMIHGDVNQSIDGINVPNGGNFEVYVRCESTNGYANVGTFVFKYCVSSAPDNEAPQIILTTPLNGMPVSFGSISQDVLVYVNKPSECKWSHENEDYDTMTETMDCEQTMSSNLLYRCSTTLNGIEDDKDNKFYFNCKSHPEYAGTENEVYRRSMAQSYEYTLKGTNSLVIDWVKPESGTTIKDATSKVNVKLEAHTSAGYKDGISWCFFKSSTDTYDLSCNLQGPGLFSNTNSLQHAQDLWLTEGEYTYQIKCCDLGGNSDTMETTFTVDTDRESPIVVRMYNENKKLKLVTDEPAKCFYSTSSCSYKIDEGIKFTTTTGREHTIEWNTNNNLYIKCKDNFDSQPAPDECTIIARPFSSM